jgi:predicted RNase H-like HicB family nuclease
MPEWEQPEPSVYECEVWFLAETAGGYSAFAAYLPGVVSQGETEEEALRELSEAIHAALESYRARGRKTPWSEEPIDLEGAEPTLKKWVLVSG